MFDGLVNPNTEKQLSNFIDNPSHAVILVGINGSGKTFLARSLSSKLLGIDIDKLDSYPYILSVTTEKGTISIESIRGLHKFVQLKTTGTGNIRRIAIVEHAEGMTIEAQNAFLKLLEEPPEDTALIVTVDNIRSLLPTVVSRLQVIEVNQPDQEDLLKYFETKGTAQAEALKAFHLSGGLPGLMASLLDGEQEHPLIQGVSDAKEFLSMDLAKRLVLVDSLSKQKDAATNMISAMQHIAQTGITQSTKAKDGKKIASWYKVLNSSFKAKEAIGVNANLKLVLTVLALNIS